MSWDGEAGALARNERAALARLLTWIETHDPRADHVMAATARTGQAHVIGVTGAPGVGKSTLASALIGVLRSDGSRVGVVAVDPSSPYTGGALLGDRLRMFAYATDPGVFIRSMASRGEIGGLAIAVPRAIDALEAYGFDYIIVETVGVGQSGVDVASQVDSTVVLLSPSTGDEVQAGKAGVMEIGDIYVVTKGDLPGASDARDYVADALQVGARVSPRGWAPMVVQVTAATGQVGDLVSSLRQHWSFINESGELDRRRRRRRIDEWRSLIGRDIARQIDLVMRLEANEALSSEVASGRISPAQAARTVLSQIDLVSRL